VVGNGRIDKVPKGAFAVRCYWAATQDIVYETDFDAKKLLII
jgi:hypothetical protein